MSTEPLVTCIINWNKTSCRESGQDGAPCFWAVHLDNPDSKRVFFVPHDRCLVVLLFVLRFFSLAGGAKVIYQSPILHSGKACCFPLRFHTYPDVLSMASSSSMTSPSKSHCQARPVFQEFLRGNLSPEHIVPPSMEWLRGSMVIYGDFMVI